MKQKTFKNFRFNVVESNKAGYHRVKVGFKLNNKHREEYLYIRDRANRNNQYYIDEAMKQVEATLGVNFEPTVTYVKRRRKRKTTKNMANKGVAAKADAKSAAKPAKRNKHMGDKRPIYVCSVIMGLIAAAFAGLFAWKIITEMKKTNSEETIQNYKLDDYGAKSKSSATLSSETIEKYTFEEKLQ